MLSLEGRRRVFRWYFDHGLSIGDIKRKLDGCRADGSPIEGEPFINRRTLQRLVKQFKETGDFAFSKRKRRIDALSDDVIQAIKDVVDEEPSRYLDEMKERLFQKHKIRTSMATICRCIHAPAPHGLGYSRLVLQRSAIEKNHAERVAFRQLIIGFDPKQFIFFDEVHKGRNESSRRRCYANRGSKYIIHERFDPSTFSMTVALNFEGFVADTCFTTRETMNADSHYLWVDVFLARMMRASCPTRSWYSTTLRFIGTSGVWTECVRRGPCFFLFLHTVPRYASVWCLCVCTSFWCVRARRV